MRSVDGTRATSRARDSETGEAIAVFVDVADVKSPTFFLSFGGLRQYPRGVSLFFWASPLLLFLPALQLPFYKRTGSIPDTDDGDEDETMDFSDAASGGEDSSGGGFPGAAAGAPPRRSSLPTLAEDSVGGGSRSTRTRSPSPSVGNLAGGGSRTASGIEGGSAGAFALPPQHPSSSGERGERAGGGEKGVFGGIAANAPTPPPPPFYGHSHRHVVQLSPLSHSG